MQSCLYNIQQNQTDSKMLILLRWKLSKGDQIDIVDARITNA